MHANVIQQSDLIHTENGLNFRDLNKNGKMDVYEDSGQPIEARVEDLLDQMTLEEKAGLLFINGAAVNEDGSIEDKPDTPGFARAAITQMTHKQMNHYNCCDISGSSCGHP